MKKTAKTVMQGFTLIELIVVITIIGILAALAIPRFVALQKDARIAKMHGLYGVIRSAAMLARTECEMDMSGNRSTTPTCSAGHLNSWANMDGVLIEMVYKYPATSPAGILSAAQIDTSNDGLAVTGGAGFPYVFTLTAAENPANCKITYTEAVFVAWPGILAPATVELTISGC